MARSPHPSRLTPMERDILGYLRERTGQIVSADEIYIWLYGYHGTPNAAMINTYIKRIRDQIGRERIRTHWHRGFVFSAQEQLSP